uniref:uncharacterized protein LOC105352771 n=1 Tax=Fragaria vesca subsp. vesca TaxID=101020 RepID=UPI0005C86114|nr:PREDICTED: uncharacterized protein LOC105352771 [Fragaria vesca subsp. vesca]
MAESGRNPNRNWTKLPDELTSAILSRLGAVEILLSAQMVCMKWRKISTDPLFWRKINMRNDGDLDDWNYEAMFTTSSIGAPILSSISILSTSATMNYSPLSPKVRVQSGASDCYLAMRYQMRA